MAHKVISIEKLSESVFTATIESPLIAEARKPGQFVIVTLHDDYSERIPLTIAGADSKNGTIRLIWQKVGKTTSEMSELKEGDTIDSIVGPLGQPTDIKKVGTVVCVGGGIGNAPLLPIATAMKNAGNKIISIIGARNKEMLILEDDFKQISDELTVVTDDGSYGRKGLVTEPLKEICESQKPDLVVAIGPAIMMKFCCETTKQYGIKTVVSLNTIMVDGTGMCGGCRVEVGGETKFVCVDGPEFDGHKVDFDGMIKRLSAYKELEEKARKQYEHDCKIGLN